MRSGPAGLQVIYSIHLTAVSLKSPSEKELVPGFYREMKLLSRMKAWLRLGDLEGLRLDEHLALEAANRRYGQIEEEALRRGPARLPGYFDLKQEQVQDEFAVEGDKLQRV